MLPLLQSTQLSEVTLFRLKRYIYFMCHLWVLACQFGQQLSLDVIAFVWTRPDPQPVCSAVSTALPLRDAGLGEGAVAVLLSLPWCQKHVKTTPSSCDRGGCGSSAIPNSNWWPPAVPTVAMTLFCFMFRLQEAVYSPDHIGFGAG